MLALINYLKCRFASRKGQGLVEYGMIIGLVAVIVLAALTVLKQPLIDFFGEIGEFLGLNTINAPST